MKTKRSLLFYLKKPKNYQKGPVLIYLRIRVESKKGRIYNRSRMRAEQIECGCRPSDRRERGCKVRRCYLGNLEQLLLAALVRDGALITA